MQTAVNGLLTHYQVLGHPSSKPLLILHGWGNSLEHWQATAQSLSSHYRVILLDLPGFGQTAQPPPGYDLFSYVKFVHQFLDKLALTNLTLLGHSLGGKISIVLAAHHPQPFQKLILVCPSGIEERPLLIRLKLLLTRLSNLTPLSQKLLSPFRNLFASTDYRQAGPLTPVFIKIINQPVDRYASRLTIPTLILWGDQDPTLPVKWSKKLNRLIRHSDLRLIWGAGHHPHLEKPTAFLNTLTESL